MTKEEKEKREELKKSFSQDADLGINRVNKRIIELKEEYEKKLKLLQDEFDILQLQKEAFEKL